MSEILVIGGGFAGLWAALGAVRKRDELGIDPGEMRVRLVNRDPWHVIRVRTYEPDLSDVRVDLGAVLRTAGIDLVLGSVEDLDAAARRVTIDGARGRETLSFDGLVLAAGSAVPKPSMASDSHDVDTYDGGAALNAHVAGLSDHPARATAVVIGAGLTGIEAACELPDKMRAAGIASPRVILVDRNAHIGSDMGDEAMAVIATALDALGIETRTGVDVAGVTADGVRLASGETIAAATVVWTAGMRASGLAGALGTPLDPLGRLLVDPFMRIEGMEAIYAAGDIASSEVAPGHSSVMSCQHGRPMGRFAGHNVVAELAGHDRCALEIPNYVTCLDLGPWGAVYTQGWDRKVVMSGAEAKQTKQTINRVRIYPPRGADRAGLLAEAGTILQAPPRPAAHQSN